MTAEVERPSINGNHPSINYCENKATYCICHSSDISKFMICCDRCNEWYHGECVKITEEHAAYIKHYYCQMCRVKNPLLQIIYKKSERGETVKKGRIKKEKKKHRLPGEKKNRSLRRCGECAGCYLTEDCGRCDFCKDMRKYGGAYKLRQKCRQRQCLNFGFKASKSRSESKTAEGSPRPLKELHYSKKRKESSKKEKSKSRMKPSRSSANRFSRQESTTGDEGDWTANATVYSSTRVRVDNTPRQCYGPQCINHARIGSKYCSEKCGLQLATNRIYKILPTRIQQWNSSPCMAETTNRKQLEKVRQQKMTAHHMLESLKLKIGHLEKIVERAKKTPLAPESDNADMDDELDLSVYCVTCGHEVPAKAAVRHFERCFNKYESQTSFGSVFKTKIEGDNMFCDVFNTYQGTYCKRLRVLCPEHTKEPKITDDEVCGCPLTVDVFTETDEYCNMMKKKCNKHFQWERLIRAEIDMERVQQWIRLDELFDHERQLRQSMANRAGVLGLMLHSTIDHDANDAMAAMHAAAAAQAAAQADALTNRPLTPPLQMNQFANYGSPESTSPVL